MKFCFAFAILVLVSSPSFADEQSALEEPDVVKTESNIFAAAGSIVPGVILHGFGHILRGEPDTGWRLIATQWIGFSTMLAGLTVLAVTGAAPEFNPPAIWMMIGGGAAFFFTWNADIYGSLGLYRIAGTPNSRVPALTLKQGAMVVANPVLDPTWFSKTELNGHLGRWKLGVTGTMHFLADDIRADVEGGYRFLGTTPSVPSVDGSFLDLELGYRFHEYDARRVSESKVGLQLRGRYDLVRFAPTLRGSFVEGSFGWAFGGISYENIGQEYTDLLLAEIVFGVYTARNDGGWGEFRMFYDHRHDGYASGSKVTGLGSGAIGNVGLSISRSLFHGWGFETRARLGSAFVADLSVVHRWE